MNPEPINDEEELAQYVERGEMLAPGYATGPDAAEPDLNNLQRVA